MIFLPQPDPSMALDSGSLAVASSIRCNAEATRLSTSGSYICAVISMLFKSFQQDSPLELLVQASAMVMQC